MADEQRRSREPTVTCPRCDTRARSTGRRILTSRFREVHYQCTDDECAIRFVCSIQTERIIGMPADVGDLGLPVVPPRATEHDPPEMMVRQAA